MKGRNAAFFANYPSLIIPPPESQLVRNHVNNTNKTS